MVVLATEGLQRAVKQPSIATLRSAIKLVEGVEEGEQTLVEVRF